MVRGLGRLVVHAALLGGKRDGLMHAVCAFMACCSGERGRGLWHAVKGKEGRAFGMLFLTFMPCYFGDYDMLLMMCCSRNDERI